MSTRLGDVMTPEMSLTRVTVVVDMEQWRHAVWSRML